MDPELLRLAHQHLHQTQVQRRHVPNRPIPIGSYAKSKSRRRVSLHPDIRERHMQIMGTPGTGKSKFLEGLIREDILAGHGLMLMDPTGNLYNDLVRWLIEKGRLDAERIILIDPNQADYSLGYNPLAIEHAPDETPTQRKHKIKNVVDTVLEAFASMLGGEDAEKMPLYTRIMNMILYAMADQGLTINEAQYLIRRSGELRGFLTAYSSHEIIRDAWDEISDLTARDFQSWFMSSTNRLEKFLLSPTMQYMFSQRRNGLNFSQIMDEGKVVLVNLAATSEGFTQQDSTFLGRLLLNDLTNKTRLRQRINGQNPRSFYCYIDECDKYLNEDVVQGIEKLRQFGLRMILAHQGLSQLRDAGERVYGAVNGSTQVKAYFSLQREDAEVCVKSAFAGHIDYQKVKEAFRSPSVVGFNREEFVDRTDAESFGGSQSTSHGSSSGWGTGASSGGMFNVDGDETGSSRGDSSFSSEGLSSSSSETSSWSRSHSETRRVGLVPELAWLPSKEYSMDEQYNQLADELSDLPKRHAILVLPNQLSVEIRAQDVSMPSCNHDRMEAGKQQYCAESTHLYRLKEDIAQELSERRLELEARMLENKPLVTIPTQTPDVIEVDDAYGDDGWQ